jgi:hypothetical protein
MPRLINNFVMLYAPSELAENEDDRSAVPITSYFGRGK